MKSEKLNMKKDKLAQQGTQQPDLIIEVCSVDLNALDSKMKISPIGEVTGLDGRLFNVDGEQVLSDLINNGLELALNVNHGWSKQGEEAAGWFNGFELKNDGIYATLELNEAGSELVKAKKYKYLSPEYAVDTKNQVQLIVGIGLVNKPNLLNKSLNNQTENEMPEKNDAGKQQLEQQNNTLKVENADLKTKLDELNSAAKLSKVDNAIKDGKLIPAKKEFALVLEDNALDTFLKLEAQAPSKTADNGITIQTDDTSNCAITKQFNGED